MLAYLKYKFSRKNRNTDNLPTAISIVDNNQVGKDTAFNQQVEQ